MRGEKWDLVFVDSGQDVGQTITDAFYVHRLLRAGGIVVFHDGLLTCRAAAVKYLIDDCGYQIVKLPKDSFLKTTARSFKYASSLGMRYVKTVVPCMHRSLVALQRGA